MAYALEVLRRLKSINIKAEAAVIAKRHEKLFADLNREQLLKGKDRMGESLPKYTEDVGRYFKSIESARAYARFKQIIHPNPQKPNDVADLYITGKYHRNIVAEVRGLNLLMKNRTPFADDIETRAAALGISPDNAKYTRENIFLPELRDRVREQTGAL